MRKALLDQLTAARAQTDALFALLTAEGLYQRPITERHRLIFYLGHLEAFDWNLICRDALHRPSREPELERLFAFGIDQLDGHTPSDAPADWPHPDHIRAWGSTARADVDDAVAGAPLEGWLEGGWAIRLAVEHRLMHAETLSYLLVQLDTRFKRPGPLPTAAAASRATPGRVHVPRGWATLGLARAEQPWLGWDNEYEGHAVEVPAFTIARLPVSNADWLEFVEAGGYRQRKLWSEATWAWREGRGFEHPAFWLRRDGQWWWRATFGDVPLPEAWPVYVSHAEATAYARWKGGRLPTEAEWHRAALGDQGALFAGEAPRPGVHGNFGFTRFDPAASASYPAGDGPFGIADLAGNGWEWTSTVFTPFAGFQALPFYRGYSADFFDGRHFVLKGASARTDATFLRPSFRNWFQPHYPFVFAKLRLIEEAP
ncbi:MAG: SUMF1/EgtB/PvdO family nonheme iron enzyme [Myxococcaceae bacterium]|nr:SUMF1/EgtB/PvdO family nonheme iron enzyme [Myxococcaceae bacterium]